MPKENIPIVIPTFTIHPDRINIYNEIQWSSGYKPSKMNIDESFINNNTNSLNNLKNNNNRNRISDSAKKKIEKAVNYLTTISDKKRVYDQQLQRSITFKLTFVTLTLPSRQIHSDQIIRKSCMHQFLIEAQKKWKIKYYIQRSERQANGNIHFHFITNQFIPHQELKDTWNRIIEKLGYITAYRESMQQWHANGFKERKELSKYWSRQQQLKAYKKGIANDWSSPNSTDVHSLKLIVNIANYICKYIGKQKRLNHGTIKRSKVNYIYPKDTNQPSVSKGAKTFIQSHVKVGRLWSCSYNLSHINGGRDTIDSSYTKELSLLYNTSTIRHFEKDYWKVIFVNIEQLQTLKCYNLLSCLNTFLSEHFNYNLQLTNHCQIWPPPNF